MSTEPSTSRRSLRVVTLLALGFALACNRSEAAPPQPAGTAEPAEPTQAQPAKPRVEAEHYIAAMTLVGECKAGKECHVEVSLEAKGNYKINDQYPSKFTAPKTPTPGITYPKPLLKKEDGKWDDKKKGSFRVPFIAASAGKAKVAGVLSLSVCSDANCLMEKQPLELDVDVK
jgi:hypothetical protein